MTLLDLKAQGRPDNFQTPSWPIEMLMHHLEQYSPLELRTNKTIWDPCCGKGNLIRTFTSLGYESLGSDLNGERSLDFLSCPMEFKGDFIITNPPYSIKDAFLTKCYELGKPFALLMPLTALEGKIRQSLYKKHGMQLLLLPKRVNFETPSGEGTGAWFPVGWFTNGFQLPERMTFLG